MASYQHIKLEGYAELQRRLNLDSILGIAWRAAWQRAVKALHENVLRYSPEQTGQTRAAIGREIDPAAVPRWARVHMRHVPTRRGFRYPGALEGSKRIKYHYRSGWRKGHLTRRWFSGAKGRSRRAIEQIFAEAGQRIRAMWEAHV